MRREGGRGEEGEGGARFSEGLGEGNCMRALLHYSVCLSVPGALSFTLSMSLCLDHLQ